MTGEVVITLPRPPTPPLSENQSRSLHWSARNKRLHPWRDEFCWLAKGHRTAIQAMAKPVTMQLTIRYPIVRRRDAHNTVGTCAKAACDGIVLAGALPDDTPEYVTMLDPILLVDRESQAVTLTIRPAEMSRARDTDNSL